MLWMNGQPNVLDRTRTVDVGQRDGGVTGNLNGWRNFPPLSQFSRRNGAGSLGRHAALAFGAVKIFSTDRARFRI